MEIRFVPPEIRSLELLTQELLLLPLFDEDRPAIGALGLVDYRLAGRISDLISQGRITSDLGAAYALPGRPKLGFERIVVVGAGSMRTFDAGAFARAMTRMLEAATEVKARRATLELPGRARELVAPEQAILGLLDVAREFGPFDTWTLIETAGAAKKMSGLSEGQADRRWGLGPPGSRGTPGR